MGTNFQAGQYDHCQHISIHVPREGHDMMRERKALPKKGISIHVPREGHDKYMLLLLIALLIFQSTCPARGTTLKNIVPATGFDDFNPRAPRGARHNKTSSTNLKIHFNPRAPRGARLYRLGEFDTVSAFQSTCPARGTTRSSS